MECAHRTAFHYNHNINEAIVADNNLEAASRIPAQLPGHAPEFVQQAAGPLQHQVVGGQHGAAAGVRLPRLQVGLEPLHAAGHHLLQAGLPACALQRLQQDHRRVLQRQRQGAQARHHQGPLHRLPGQRARRQPGRNCLQEGPRGF